MWLTMARADEAQSLTIVTTAWPSPRGRSRAPGCCTSCPRSSVDDGQAARRIIVHRCRYPRLAAGKHHHLTRGRATCQVVDRRPQPWFISQTNLKPSSVSHGALIWMASVSAAIRSTSPPVPMTFIDGPSSLRNRTTIPSTSPT